MTWRQLRREHFGFIFQRYHLLPDLTAAGNVETPAIYLGRDPAERRAEAKRLLARLGLKDRAGHTPNQLSGGQQQRVSIARALINGGDVILADEPTGALDTTTGEEVMRILRQLNSEGRTIIIVTHDMKVAEHADRIIEISDGEIIADRRKPGTAPAAQKVETAATCRRAGRAGATGSTKRSTWRSARCGRTSCVRSSPCWASSSGLRRWCLWWRWARGRGSRCWRISASWAPTRLMCGPASGFGDRRSSAIRTLTVADAEAIAAQSYIDSSDADGEYKRHAAAGQCVGFGDGEWRGRPVFPRARDEAGVEGSLLTAKRACEHQPGDRDRSQHQADAVSGRRETRWGR